MKVFEKAKISGLTLKNRIIRSATFEGMCDDNGYPLPQYEKMYKQLSLKEIGGIITGFAFINKQGRAIHPGQAGIDDEDKIPYYKKITSYAHLNKTKIFIQIAHTGRQTKKRFTGQTIVAPSGKRSIYFMEKPEILSNEEIKKNNCSIFIILSICKKSRI